MRDMSSKGFTDGSLSKKENNEKILLACEEGNGEIVDLLKDYVSEETLNLALCRAAMCGKLDCLQKLDKYSDATYKNSLALSLAAESGHADCVKYLILRSDLKANNGDAITRAVRYGTSACVNLLSPYGDLDTSYHERINLFK